MTAALVGCKAKIRREKGMGRNRDRWWLHIPRQVAACLEAGGVDLRVGISRHRVVFWAGKNPPDELVLSARLWIHTEQDRGSLCFPDSPLLIVNQSRPPGDVATGWLWLDAKDAEKGWDFRLRWEAT